MVMRSVLFSRLADEKYRTWEWNWGRSGELGASRNEYFPFGLVQADYSLSGGLISEIIIRGDFFSRRDIKEFEKKLTGKRFAPDDVAEAADGIGEYIMGATPKDLVYLLFGV